MDEELAQWLTGLIAQTLAQQDRRPGLTCEVQGEARMWVQVIPKVDDSTNRLDSILLNFTYDHEDPPLVVLEKADLKPPPGTREGEWEPGGFAGLWIRPDIPVVALALFVGDIIQKVLQAPAGYELAAWIEYGF